MSRRKIASLSFWQDEQLSFFPKDEQQIRRRSGKSTHTQQNSMEKQTRTSGEVSYLGHRAASALGGSGTGAGPSGQPKGSPRLLIFFILLYKFWQAWNNITSNKIQRLNTIFQNLFFF
jgi:hypothetical protein